MARTKQTAHKSVGGKFNLIAVAGSMEGGQFPRYRQDPS